MGGTRRNIAFFGGSFDPPHVCHVRMVELALESGAVDQVLAVPCFNHPLAKAVSPFEHRFEMVRLALAPLGRQVRLSRLEEELGGAGRTLDILEELARRHPDASFRLLIGSDILNERNDWYRFDAVERLAPPLIIGREGYGGPGERAAVLPDVSSFEVRRLARRREPISHLVPPLVAAYIEEHGLYQGAGEAT